jgi:hypothetical protein
MYMPNGFENQDPNSVMPMMQNIGNQQAFQNQMINQGNQIASQSHPNNSGGGFNPIAMATALRGKQEGAGLGQTYNSFGKVISDPTYGVGNIYKNMTPGEIANMQQYGV